MVTANAYDSAEGIVGVFQDREVVALASVTGTLTGGFFAAQEIADRVLPMLDFPENPTQPMDIGASVLVKLLATSVLVLVGAGMGGDLVTLAAGAGGAGMLVSVGMDVVDLGQRQFGNGNGNGNGSSSPARRRSSSASPVRRASASRSPSTKRAQPMSATGGSAAGRNGFR